MKNILIPFFAITLMITSCGGEEQTVTETKTLTVEEAGAKWCELNATAKSVKGEERVQAKVVMEAFEDEMEALFTNEADLAKLEDITKACD